MAKFLIVSWDSCNLSSCESSYDAPKASYQLPNSCQVPVIYSVPTGPGWPEGYDARTQQWSLWRNGVHLWWRWDVAEFQECMVVLCRMERRPNRDGLRTCWMTARQHLQDSSPYLFRQRYVEINHYRLLLNKNNSSLWLENHENYSGREPRIISLTSHWIIRREIFTWFLLLVEHIHCCTSK